MRQAFFVVIMVLIVVAWAAAQHFLPPLPWPIEVAIPAGLFALAWWTFAVATSRD